MLLVPEEILRLLQYKSNQMTTHCILLIPVDDDGVEEVSLLLMFPAVETALPVATAPAVATGPAVAIKLVLFGEFVVCCCC